MADPLTINGAVIGIISFLSVARQGIQQFHDDTLSWRKFPESWDFYLVRATASKEDLASWRDTYMVWDDDGKLFQDLWGDEWTTITRFLRRIYNVSKSIDEEIESLRRPTSGTAKRFRYTGRKCFYIFWKKKHLDELFHELGTLVPELKRMSWDKFRNKHREKAQCSEPTDEMIHEVGNAFQLVRLANATQLVAQALYQPCLDAQQKLSMFMKLNFFGEDVANSRSEDIATSRSKAISVSAKASQIHFTFLARERPNPLTRIRVINGMSVAAVNYDRSLTYAFDKIFRRQEGVIGYEHYTGGPRFLVKEVWQEQREPLWPDSYRRFRTVLFEKQPYPDPPQGRHMALSKIKAASELVECGLLLLRTKWLYRFCSCGLRHRALSTGEHEYLLGATGQEDEDRKKQCWCNYMPNANLSLRYVGLLLVEIALGQPVNGLLSCDPQEDFAEDFPEPFRLGFPSEHTPPVKYFTLAETLEKVGKASGGTPNAYVDAVKYCLTSQLRYGEVQESELKDYYWEVLAP